MDQSVRAPWKNAPWTPLKVNEVNKFFGGGGYNMWAILIFQKNGSTLVYFGLGCAVPNLQTPIRGHHHHPVLYLQIQVAEKYSTAMCYITVTKARFIELLRQLNLNFQVNKRLSIAKMWNVRNDLSCRCGRVQMLQNIAGVKNGISVTSAKSNCQHFGRILWWCMWAWILHVWYFQANMRSVSGSWTSTSSLQATWPSFSRSWNQAAVAAVFPVSRATFTRTPFSAKPWICWEEAGRKTREEILEEHLCSTNQAWRACSSFSGDTRWQSIIFNSNNINFHLR